MTESNNSKWRWRKIKSLTDVVSDAPLRTEEGSDVVILTTQNLPVLSWEDIVLGNSLVIAYPLQEDGSFRMITTSPVKEVQCVFDNNLRYTTQVTTENSIYELEKLNG